MKKATLILFIISFICFIVFIVLFAIFDTFIFACLIIIFFTTTFYYVGWLLGYYEGYHKRLKEPHLVYIRELKPIKPRDNKGRFVKRTK